VTCALAALGLTTALGASGSMAHPNEGPSGGGNGTGSPATPDAGGRFVPDMVMRLPGRVGVVTRPSSRGPRTLLTFDTAVENYGAGPLIVRASQPSSGAISSTFMPAWQVVARSDGRRERVGGAMRIVYVEGGGHSHWHLEDFQRFELRTVSGTPLRRDRKTGFCLGDRYDASPSVRMAGEPARSVYRARCGLNQPGRSSLTQGISVGFGDRYPARLEGQFVNITGLATGRYVLVLTVDPEGRMLDMHEDNDTSSVLVKIVRGARTRARILSWCNGTASCPTPGVGVSR
jgi:hypothetical protein